MNARALCARIGASAEPVIDAAAKYRAIPASFPVKDFLFAG